MSQKEKPKRKNLSPEELLQEADLLYPENEAFVIGKSKELHPKATIFANIRVAKYGFPINPDSFKTINPERAFNFGFMLSVIGMFLCAGTPALFVNWIALEGETIIPISTIIFWNITTLPLLLIGLAALYSFGKMLNFRQKHIQRDYTHLIQQGKLILGEVINFDLGKVRMSTIKIRFYIPNDNKKRHISWYLGKRSFLKKGDKVIILHLDDKLSIVL